MLWLPVLGVLHYISNVLRNIVTFEVMKSYNKILKTTNITEVILLTVMHYLVTNII